MKKIFYSAIIISFALSLNSCSDDFTKTDQNSTFSEERIENLARFPEAALKFTESIEAGGYNTMRTYNIGESNTHEDFGQKSTDIALDAMGQDLVFASSSWFVFHYTYQMRVESLRGSSMLYRYYAKLAHNANLVLQSVAGSNPDYASSPVYARALALRGFANYYLMVAFANKDLGIGYEYVDFENGRKLEIKYNRVPSNDVYKFIEDDLVTAYNVLAGYSRGGSKTIIDQSVVSGLLSRFYLWKKDFTNAQKYSLDALGGNLSAVDFNTLNDGFAKVSNPDVMWGSVTDGSNTGGYASFFSHMDSQNRGYAGSSPKLIDARLYAQISNIDKRKSWFYNGEDVLISPSTGAKLDSSNFPFLANIKFVDTGFSTGDYLYMRKSEMLLNYAEAAYENGDEGEAKKALDLFMSSRFENYSSASFSGVALQNEIRLQRRIELWGEGFGLIDIKRWGVELNREDPLVIEGKTIQSNHGMVPGTKFNIPAGSDRLNFQFPISEINANRDLRPQNP